MTLSVPFLFLHERPLFNLPFTSWDCSILRVFYDRMVCLDSKIWKFGFDFEWFKFKYIVWIVLKDQGIGFEMTSKINGFEIMAFQIYWFKIKIQVSKRNQNSNPKVPG